MQLVFVLLNELVIVLNELVILINELVNTPFFSTWLAKFLFLLSNFCLTSQYTYTLYKMCAMREFSERTLYQFIFRYNFG